MGRARSPSYGGGGAHAIRPGAGMARGGCGRGGEPEEVAASIAGGGPSSLARVAQLVSVYMPQSLVWSRTHAPCPPAPASLKRKCCSTGYQVAGSLPARASRTAPPVSRMAQAFTTRTPFGRLWRANARMPELGEGGP